MTGAEGPDPWMELYEAAEAVDFERVRQLLKKYPTVRRPAAARTWLEHTTWIAFHRAHVAGDPGAVKRLLKKDPWLEKSVTKSGQPWLIHAVWADSVALARFWVDRGATRGIREALLHARTAAMATFLLQHGANVNARSEVFGTPLHVCKDPDQVKVLLKAGADPTITDEQGLTAQEKLAKLGRVAAAQALVDAPAPTRGRRPAAAGKRASRPTGGTLTVDMRKELPELMAYLARRVKEHAAAASGAGSKKAATVRRIDFGFEFGQANWVVLVFDTRDDAKRDGEWTRRMNKILLKRPAGPVWHKLADDANVNVIDLKGRTVNAKASGASTRALKVIGDTLRHALQTAHARGLFKPLPTSRAYELGVEHLEGHYGWNAKVRQGLRPKARATRS